MARMRVAVLRGGPSSEYDVSLQSGAAVLQGLSQEVYAPFDVFIDRRGVWHVGGVPREPAEAIQEVDVVFNALHGEYGEDGGVQELLERFGVPYTGSSVLASRLAMNKDLAKRFLEREGVRTPLYRVLQPEETTERAIAELFRTFPQPSVVKPLALGSSVGVTIARDFFSFRDGLAKVFSLGSAALVEEYIEGREVTCGVIDAFRGEAHYTLPLIEIVPPPGAAFYDYGAKYVSNETGYRCPAPLPAEVKRELAERAIAAHRSLGLRHYSRSDFIVHPRRGVFFLEANTLPGMTDHSLIPKGLAAVGCALPAFLDHVIALAREGR